MLETVLTPNKIDGIMEAQQTKLPLETGGLRRLSSSFGGGGSVAITPVSGTSKKRDAWGLVQCQYSKDIVQENRAAVNRQIDGFSTKNLADIDNRSLKSESMDLAEGRVVSISPAVSAAAADRMGISHPAYPTKKRREDQAGDA